MPFKVSVITVNLNNKDGLKRTIQSVLSQLDVNIEYIIIDGGSTDGSLKLINEFHQSINFWSSEKDNGVYNAMNKGISKATGDYLIFLNSGDHFFKENSLAALSNNSVNADIIFGDLIVNEEQKEWVKVYPDVLTFRSFLIDSLPHPCTIIKRKLFYTVGLYNEDLKIASDWAFFMNAICRHNASYLHIHLPISVFYVDGISSQVSNQELIKDEKSRVLEQNYGAFIPDYNLLKSLEHELRNIQNSRLHKILNRIWSSKFYKILN